ncbi:alpha-1,3-mannosylglycoprotein 2-beta-N-acetylglucosaminyltransferase [Aureococcus anophagefferens]|nr:alpha-1,3-mannosylglycoprotein 2-beta-N-acetylglucosaminyltransferase [Aureococcus anophagefferens]
MVAAAARDARPGAGRSRMEEYLMLALKVMIALVVLHMVGWEMSQEPDLLLASTNLRHRLDGIKTTQAEVQGLVDARRGGGAAAASAAAPESPAARRRRRAAAAADAASAPTAPPRRADAEAPTLGGVVLVVMAHDRAASVRDCLRVPAVAAGGGAPRRRRVHGRAGAYGDLERAAGTAGAAAGAKVLAWRHGYAPRADAPKRFAGDALAKISEHVRAALAEAFRVPGAEFALLLEDDLRVAGDFFDLFAFAAVELRRDDSLWCASAWNDNAGPAAAGFDWRPGVLRRTTYFPGLGWMVGKATFERPARPAAPTTGWDHWIRAATRDGGRECLFPRCPACATRRRAARRTSGLEAAALERHAFAGDASAVRAFELAPSDLAGAVGGAPRVALGDVGNLPRGGVHARERARRRLLRRVRRGAAGAARRAERDAERESAAARAAEAERGGARDDPSR